MANIPYPNGYDDDFINIFKQVITMMNNMGYTYEESLQKAQDILEEARQTNDMNKSVQEQVNNFISAFEGEGTTNFELVQARGDKSTVGERLDEGDDERTKVISNVRDLGINARNFTSLQDAIDSLGTSGGKINVPGTYSINEPITIDSNKIEIVGQENARLNKSENFVGDSFFKSLIEERENVTGSLEHVVIKDLLLDGVDKSIHGADFSRFTRGCKIENVEMINVNDGIRLKDSWSFIVGNNVMNQLAGKGINFINSVNVASVVNNSIRNANYGMFTERMNGSKVTGNTFELNDYNAQISGHGNTIGGNYFELPNIENVIYGGVTEQFAGNVVGGNFYDNVGESKSAAYLLNAVNNSFDASFFRNVIYMYLLTSQSIVEDNEFFIPNIADTTSFRKEGVSSVYGEILGGNNRVHRDKTVAMNTNDIGSSNSLADWRINTPAGNFTRIGKISSGSDRYTFTGDLVKTFDFRKDVHFNEKSHFNGEASFGSNAKIGFFGKTPVWPSSVSGATTEEKLDNLISKLREYGLLN